MVTYIVSNPEAEPKTYLETALAKLPCLKGSVKRHPVGAFIAAFTVFFIIMYAPFALRGGLTYDDWSVARLGRGCPGFVASFKCYWPNYTHRPLATFYYAGTTNLFADWAPGYIMVTAAVWFTAMMVMLRVLRRTFGLVFAGIFVFFASIPSVSSSIIFSPAMQSVGTVSFLVWALSLWCLDSFTRTRDRRYLAGCFLLMMASLLFYESSLPLFVISAVWPLMVRREGVAVDAAYARKYVARYIIPIGVVVALVLFYQKVLIVRLAPNTANLSKFLITGSMSAMLDFAVRVLVDSAYLFIIGIPAFAARALLRLKQYSGLTIGSVAAAAVLAVFAVRRALGSRVLGNVSTRRFSGWYLAGVIICISGMHFVALAPPTIVGYLNRGMVAGSIAVAFLAAVLWSRYARRSLLFVLVFIIFFTGYTASFIVQRNNFMLAAAERSRIQADLGPKIANADGSSQFILANVPTYLNVNFNNETVFSDEVLDWDHFMFLKFGDVTRKGINLTQARLTRKEISLVDGKLVTIDTEKPVPLDKVWFYDTDTKEFSKVGTEERLTELFKQARDAQAITPVDGDNRELLFHWLSSY